MPNAIITITEEEQVQLEEILIDRDEQAALEFLERAVKAKIARHLKAQCKPQV